MLYLNSGTSHTIHACFLEDQRARSSFEAIGVVHVSHQIQSTKGAAPPSIPAKQRGWCTLHLHEPQVYIQSDQIFQFMAISWF